MKKRSLIVSRPLTASRTLPFRTVNRILAAALRTKKRQILPYCLPYAADLDAKDLEARCVDKESLDSAISAFLNG